MYVLFQVQIDSERDTRQELARICGQAIEASEGINRTCGEAYRVLTQCLVNNYCDSGALKTLNEEKMAYEQGLKKSSEEMVNLINKNQGR